MVLLTKQCNFGSVYHPGYVILCLQWCLIYTEMLGVPGYFHADPHPGNILATQAGELVYLDFGMMSEAPLSARFQLTWSFLSCV